METRIRELREAQGLKRTELAERAGVTYTALTKWERGDTEMGLDNAAAVARALHCTISELIGKDAPKRDGRFDEIAGIYRSMDEDGKNALLGTARGLRDMYSAGEETPARPARAS